MPGASDLRHRAAFDRRVKVDDGAGNTEGEEWQEQFTRRAAYIYAGGGETAMAARLEGRGVLKVRVRSCSQTRRIRQDWQMRDVWEGTIYAVKEVDAVTNRQWVYLVVERGVAS